MTSAQSKHAEASLCDLGVFDRFSGAWLACLERVLDEGWPAHDAGRPMRELMNVSLSALGCDVTDLLASGADRARLRLMAEKYESQEIVPPYLLSYGRLFRDHDGVDQIDWLIRRLVAKRETKSATIGFHVPGHDVLSCISLLDCKIRHDRLWLTAVYRSQNVFGSQPGNACALARIQQEVARRLEIGCGPITLHILSAHIYEDDWAAARRVLRAARPVSEVRPAGHG